jgi:hypothetical protein
MQCAFEGQASPHTPGQRCPQPSCCSQRRSHGRRRHGAPHGSRQLPCRQQQCKRAAVSKLDSATAIPHACARAGAGVCTRLCKQRSRPGACTSCPSGWQLKFVALSWIVHPHALMESSHAYCHGKFTRMPAWAASARLPRAPGDGSSSRRAPRRVRRGQRSACRTCCAGTRPGTSWCRADKGPAGLCSPPSPRGTGRRRRVRRTGSARTASCSCCAHALPREALPAPAPGAL